MIESGELGPTVIFSESSSQQFAVFEQLVNIPLILSPIVGVKAGGIA